MNMDEYLWWTNDESILNSESLMNPWQIYVEFMMNMMINDDNPGWMIINDEYRWWILMNIYDELMMNPFWIPDESMTNLCWIHDECDDPMMNSWWVHDEFMMNDEW